MGDPVECCPLVPDVPLEDCASILIRRVLEDGDGAEHLASIPFAWPPETTEVEIGEACGGGMFQAQARGSDGRFIKGAKAHRFILDAAPRAFEPPGRLAAARGNAPGAPTAPGAPIAGMPYGDQVQADQRAEAERRGMMLSPSGVAIPYAQPLGTQPSAFVDLPELAPEIRHVTQYLLALNAQHWSAVREAANVERESARGATSVALAFAKGESEVVSVYRDVVARERDRADAAEREVVALRERVRVLELDVERAKVRAALGAEVRPESLLDVLLGTLRHAVDKLGVPVVAGALGLSPVELEAYARGGVKS